MTDPQNAAAELLASNRRRRSIRKWIAIGSLPLVLVALFFVGKILSMYSFAHQSISAFVVDDYAGSETAARGQEFANWFEPYKAPFNVGTALAGAGELDAARTELEKALALAHGVEVCGVRINLAIVLERQGDEARADGDREASTEFYAEALTMVLETPEECYSPEAQSQSSDPERDMGEGLEESKDRLKEKQGQQGQEPEEQEPQDPEEQKPDEQDSQPDEQKLEDLKDKLDQGTQERDQQQQGDEPGPGSGGTDKPW